MIIKNFFDNIQYHSLQFVKFKVETYHWQICSRSIPGTSGTRRLASNPERERSENQERERSDRADRSADRDSFSRWRDRQYFGPRRWLETALRDSAWEPGKSLYLK